MHAITRCALYRSVFSALLLVPASPLLAATFTPDSFQDRIDANPGDGVCATAAPVVCTLRAAVMEANALAGTDTIVLPAGTYRLTLSGINENASLTGDLDITDAAGLTIQAQGSVKPVIDANALDRALDVHAGAFVLSGIRVINGRAIQPELFGDSSSGGGVLLRNAGNSLIHLSDIEDNQASLFGGGILKADQPGTLTIMLSRVANNRAGLGADGGAGGGLFIYGGGDATVQLSRFEGNQASFGGAIYMQDSALLLRYSAFNANHAVARQDGEVGGAGVHAKNATMRIENSSLYRHQTKGGAGHMERGAIVVEDGGLQMFSSTVAENAFCGIHSSMSDVTLQNVTVADNQCGLRWFNAPFLTTVARSLFVRNSVLSYNRDADCNVMVSPPDVRDIDGHNLDSDGSCNLAAGFGNLPNMYPRLNLLDTTMALPALMPYAGSPLIDAGSPLDPTSGNPEACFQFDQLGVARQPGRCDIGAVERMELFSDGFESPTPISAG